ncbi:ORF6N domain-containing protein [Xenorhabdus sp. XENO-7]|uniref:ORF6N domain-containing protein n=1 Tax=Xenorhabdus aichiensis TaxID=3025874 RepID=A0ABT5M879_9GAMM|nr:ORF6N domain-containing protein [Xenorhabdus aichiensis]MDC9623917.1 ORF6N domain-containing protein [Xenorhabdus aichiensis]
MSSIPVNELTKSSNSVQNMTAIMHNSIPVITTELLADIYETDVINIQVNHSRNKDRFVEGKHFFKLTGSILKEFKNRLTQSKSVKNRLSLSESVDNRLTNSQLVGKRARSLILWTERGAARHAKMLDTDKAWDVFEALEDFYFNQKEAEPVAAKTTTQSRTPLRGLVNTIMGKYGLNSKKLFQMVHHEFGVNHIDELTHDQLPSAMEYLAAKVIEGEFLGKEEMPIPYGYSGFTGRLLMELENGETIYSQALTPKHHVSTLNDFMEIAQRAGYLLIHKEDMQPMMKALEGYKFNA